MNQEDVKVYTLRELIGHERNPDNSIISDGLMKHGALLVIGGPPKTYKSFILNTLAVALATGQNLFSATRTLHREPEKAFTVNRPYRVLICEQEMGEDDLEDRLKPLIESLSPELRELALGNIMTISLDHDIKFDTAEGMEHLEDVVTVSKADIVIFDPLIEFHSQEENSNTAMATMLKNLVTFCRRTGVTPVLSHHEGKEGMIERSGADRLRGAGALFAKGDAFVSVKVINRNACQLQLDFTLRRGKPLKSLIVRLHPDTMAVEFVCWHGSKQWKETVAKNAKMMVAQMGEVAAD